MYQVTGGLRTSKSSDANSCAEVGMHMVVPRTEAHFDAMLREFGTDYFQIVPGIIGNSDASMSGKVMKSTAWSDPSSMVPAVDSVWKAVDGGDWYLRDTPFTEPHGAYTPGCWMSMLKWQQGNYHFAANDCDYSSNNYICSTNDKGGPSVVSNNKLVNAYPAGAEKGKYVISYHVTDKSGNRECKTLKRTVLVKDTLAPVITVKIGDIVKVAGVLKDRKGNELRGSGMSLVKEGEKAKTMAAAAALAAKSAAARAAEQMNVRRLFSSEVFLNVHANAANGGTTTRTWVALVALGGTAMVLAAVLQQDLANVHAAQGVTI